MHGPAQNRKQNGTTMNNEYTNGIKKNILAPPLFRGLVACLVILFIAYGCTGNKPAIINAAGAGDINTVKMLKAEGRNINEVDSNGATALMYAIWSKKYDTAKYLIESGANIKAKDINGYDALIYAVDYMQFDLMLMLLDKGADIETKDSLGNTPLAHAALQLGNLSFVKMLIKSGADVNTRNYASEPLLDSVYDYGALNVFAELINAGAKLLEPPKGQARLVLLGFLNSTAMVTVGKVSKYLGNGKELSFVNVNPGFHTIERTASWNRNQPKFSIDAKAGQTYYIKILQNEISFVEESAAKAKIKELLKTSN